MNGKRKSKKVGKMRTLAGILTIIGGLLGGSLWFGISGWLVPDFTQTVTTGDTAVALVFLTVLIRFLPAFLAVMGGIYILKRKRWRWALAGAICSLLFPFFGIPAIIFLIKRKGEFD